MTSDEREHPCDPPALPPSLTGALAGYFWARTTVGESGGAVYRLYGRPGAPDLFLKHGTGPVAHDLAAEDARLRWLQGRLPAPEVTQFLALDDAAWLVMSALPGQTAYELLSAEDGAGLLIADALAAFLRRLHSLDPRQCPFSSDHVLRLAQGRARAEAGLVDVADFDPERSGWSAAQVLEELDSLLPLAPDPVVTHGDFSLDNLLLVGGEVIGCIDVGRLGIADRYQDLAIMWNCLCEFDPTLQRRFMATYGLPEPDLSKLQFHLLLDELF